MLKALSPLGPRLPEDAINPKPSHLPWNLFIWPLRKHGTLNPKHHFGANRASPLAGWLAGSLARWFIVLAGLLSGLSKFIKKGLGATRRLKINFCP